MWHQQHLEKIGLICSASLIIQGDNLYAIEHQSDLVQRIFLKKKYRTRINSHFKYWHYMLLNSIFNFAVENNLANIFSPTADLVLKKIISRKINRKFIDRIYDKDLSKHFEVIRKKDWWVVNVFRNYEKLVTPEIKDEIVINDKKLFVLITIFVETIVI